jgi:hypothetical protein
MGARGYRRSGPPSGRASTTTAAQPWRTRQTGCQSQPLESPAHTALRRPVELRPHPRVIRRPAVAIRSIRRVEHVQVELVDSAEDGPHKVIVRHPIHQRRRHQPPLTTITRYEILRHTRKCLKRARQTLYPTASVGSGGVNWTALWVVDEIVATRIASLLLANRREAFGIHDGCAFVPPRVSGCALWFWPSA